MSTTKVTPAHYIALRTVIYREWIRPYGELLSLSALTRAAHYYQVFTMILDDSYWALLHSLVAGLVWTIVEDGPGSANSTDQSELLARSRQLLLTQLTQRLEARQFGYAAELVKAAHTEYLKYYAPVECRTYLTKHAASAWLSCLGRPATSAQLELLQV